MKMILTDFLTEAATVIASAAAVWSSIKYIIKPIWKFIVDTRNMHGKLDIIVHELTTNNGSSIKDALARIEKKQIELEKKQIDASLRCSAHMNQLVEAFFTTDSYGNLVWTNNYFLKLVGRRFDEIKNNNWICYIPQEQAHDVFNEWKLAVSQQRNFNYVHDIEDNNGHRRRAVNVSAEVMYNPDGSVLGYFGKMTLLPGPELYINANNGTPAIY